MFTMRFDMRAPTDGPATTRELYRAAIELSAWGESRGCVSAMVSEHHSSPDGYLPSPLILASAIAARSESLPVSVGAVLLNLYDPIKLAEDMVILDIVSGGRVSYTVGLGYREEEYAMFGVDMKKRASVMNAKLDGLLRALRGERFVYEGRPVHVTPAAFTEGGPKVSYGGQSPAAARRAGRFGLDFFAGGGGASLAEVYREAAVAAGHEPGQCAIPEGGAPMSLFVARDVDKAWKEIGHHLLHDARMYAEWMGADDLSVTKSNAATVDSLRAENGNYQIVTPDRAIEIIRAGSPLFLQPMCGGCPPAYAWDMLKLIESDVLPALS